MLEWRRVSISKDNSKYHSVFNSILGLFYGGLAKDWLKRRANTWGELRKAQASYKRLPSSFTFNVFFLDMVNAVLNIDTDPEEFIGRYCGAEKLYTNIHVIAVTG